MNKDAAGAIVAILLAIVGVATVAVLVSGSANTSNVLTSLGNSIKTMICVAVSPVTGGGNCGTSVSSTINFGNVLS